MRLEYLRCHQTNEPQLNNPKNVIVNTTHSLMTNSPHDTVEGALGLAAAAGRGVGGGGGSRRNACIVSREQGTGGERMMQGSSTPLPLAQALM
jgi:hypothetical protein